MSALCVSAALCVPSYARRQMQSWSAFLVMEMRITGLLYIVFLNKSVVFRSASEYYAQIRNGSEDDVQGEA